MSKKVIQSIILIRKDTSSRIAMNALFYENKRLSRQFFKSLKIILALEKELELLQLEYSDLHVIETPWQLASKSEELDGQFKTDSGDLPIFLGGEGIPTKKYVPIRDVWEQMERVYEKGMTKAIGLANCDEDLINHISGRILKR